jgi:uncharacterized protein
VIAAHSLGTLLVAHWLRHTAIRIRGAMLVAVPDPDGPSFPREAEGFSPVSYTRLPCPSIVVASSNGAYSDVRFAQRCADSWGSRFVNIGDAGHIHSASGLGGWSEGQHLLQTLIAANE